MIIQSQFLMKKSLTDYTNKKPLQSHDQILDESKNFGSNSTFVNAHTKKDKYYIYN